MSGNNGYDGASGSGSGFVLIVVLFILLIIVGASFMCGYGDSGY
ncbi:YjcZ family sporulation protein [Psychrobacillus sp. NPDC096623]